MEFRQKFVETVVGYIEVRDVSNENEAHEAISAGRYKKIAERALCRLGDWQVI